MLQDFKENVWKWDEWKYSGFKTVTLLQTLREFRPDKGGRLWFCPEDQRNYYNTIKKVIVCCEKVIF